MNKKFYMEPLSEEIELALEMNLLAGSTPSPLDEEGGEPPMDDVPSPGGF